MRKLTSILIVSVFLFTSASAAPKSEKKTAILVDVRPIPGCAGLDCPPWPTPREVEVCLQADGTYYTGWYSPWEVPWVTSGLKLLPLKGQSVEIVVTDKEVRIVTPRMRLKRTHNDLMFGFPCKSA